MARRRVYFMPFLPNGTYGAWTEVTQDIDASTLGAISRALDISDYDIGVYTNSAVAVSLRNEHGKYSDINSPNTIFALKRGDSQVKITWDQADWDFFAGVSRVGEIQGQEVVIYQGLLNDDSTVMQLTGQEISFNILGYESILDRTLAPDWVATPPADNHASTLIKSLLPAANLGVTVPLLTIDNTQINPGNDVIWDDLTVFANQTCREALNTILEGSNSVLFINGTTPVVSARTPSGSVLKTFYGPGSSLGPENIIDIQDVQSGLNRTFNYVTWTDTTLVSLDAGSVSTYGIRKKDLAIDGITNPPKQQSVLDSIRTEFASPKQEFKLLTPLTYDALSLPLLSKIAIDFPLVPIQSQGSALYEVAQYEVDSYPIEISSFQVLLSETYKVIGMDVDAVADNITFYLRRI